MNIFKKQINNFLFIPLFIAYLFYFPFALDVNNIYEVIIFFLVLIVFYVNFFFVLRGFYNINNKFSSFLNIFLIYYLSFFLILNIDNIFLWDSDLHQKYFLPNLVNFIFHFFILIILFFISLKKYIVNFKIFSKQIFISLFILFGIYFFLPNLKISKVPDEYFPLNNSYEYKILSQNFDFNNRNTFLEEKKYYLNKINLFDNYKEILKIDLYNYYFLNQTNSIRSRLDLPFLISYSDLLKYDRLNYYNYLTIGKKAELKIPKIGKYYFSNLFLKSSLENSFPINEKIFNMYLSQLKNLE